MTAHPEVLWWDHRLQTCVQSLQDYEASFTHSHPKDPLIGLWQEVETLHTDIQKRAHKILSPTQEACFLVPKALSFMEWVQAFLKEYVSYLGLWKDQSLVSIWIALIQSRVLGPLNDTNELLATQTIDHTLAFEEVHLNQLELGIQKHLSALTQEKKELTYTYQHLLTWQENQAAFITQAETHDTFSILGSFYPWLHSTESKRIEGMLRLLIPSSS